MKKYSSTLHRDTVQYKVRKVLPTLVVCKNCGHRFYRKESAATATTKGKGSTIFCPECQQPVKIKEKVLMNQLNYDLSFSGNLSFMEVLDKLADEGYPAKFRDKVQGWLSNRHFNTQLLNDYPEDTEDLINFITRQNKRSWVVAGKPTKIATLSAGSNQTQRTAQLRRAVKNRRLRLRAKPSIAAKVTKATQATKTARTGSFLTRLRQKGQTMGKLGKAIAHKPWMRKGAILAGIPTAIATGIALERKNKEISKDRIRHMFTLNQEPLQYSRFKMAHSAFRNLTHPRAASRLAKRRLAKASQKQFIRGGTRAGARVGGVVGKAGALGVGGAWKGLKKFPKASVAIGAAGTTALVLNRRSTKSRQNVGYALQYKKFVGPPDPNTHPSNMPQRPQQAKVGSMFPQHSERPKVKPLTGGGEPITIKRKRKYKPMAHSPMSKKQVRMPTAKSIKASKRWTKFTDTMGRKPVAWAKRLGSKTLSGASKVGLTTIGTAMLVHQIREIDKRGRRKGLNLPRVKVDVDQDRNYVLTPNEQIELYQAADMADRVYYAMPKDIGQLGKMTIDQLKRLKVSIGVGLKGVKSAVVRGLGAFYLGLIANEILGRGVSHKKVRAQQTVTLKPEEYALPLIAKGLAMGAKVLKAAKATKAVQGATKLGSRAAGVVKKPVGRFMSKPSPFKKTVTQRPWGAVKDIKKKVPMSRGEALRAGGGKTWRGLRKGTDVAFTGMIAADVARAGTNAVRNRKRPLAAQKPYVDNYDPYYVKKDDTMQYKFAMPPGLAKKLAWGIGGIGAVGLAAKGGQVALKNKAGIRDFSRGFQMGLRDGQLEVQGKKASPSAMKMAVMQKLHGSGYASGRQQALSRAGLHGGSTSKQGAFENFVNIMKAPPKTIQNSRKGKEMSINYNGLGMPTAVEAVPDPNMRPGGTYVCPEGCAVSVTWKTPQDKYKLKCPKCNTQMVLKETKKVLPTLKADYQLHRVSHNTGQRNFSNRSRSLNYFGPQPGEHARNLRKTGNLISGVAKPLVGKTINRLGGGARAHGVASKVFKGVGSLTRGALRPKY